MAEYKAVIEWKLEAGSFSDNRYSRGHRWLFDGGIEVPASASPNIVPLPWSIEAAVDPEEAFVASLSSCHMLWFLSIAAKRGFTVAAYRDEAVGIMGRDAPGKYRMTQVTLRSAVQFSGANQPSPAETLAMHHEAHDRCFIARSVKTEVRCEPVWENRDSQP